MNSLLLYYIGIGAAVLLPILLIILFIYLRRKRVFRRLLEEQSAPLAEGGEWPRASIVIVSQDCCAALEHGLPSLLEQDYPQYEVVVVDAASTDYTKEVIKRLSQRYDHLRSTFISSDNQIGDIDQYALMLGLRSARADWVLITTPGCEADSDEWLKRMMRHADSNTDLVIGTGEGHGASNLLIRKEIYARNSYSLEHLEKRFRCVYEWSPQACIYQRQ